MVEMRRVVSLLMDEVLYFLERAAEWAEPPILYPVITESLQDETRTLADSLLPIPTRLQRGLVECSSIVCSRCSIAK